MPKSRGRPTGRGKKKALNPVRKLRLSDFLLPDAATIRNEENVLEVEHWASGWLGQAWATAGADDPEHLLCLEVAGQAASQPSPDGLAAVTALRRIVAPAELALLDGTIELLRVDQPLPKWSGAGAFTPTRAWRAADLPDTEHVLFVEYDGAVPHTLMIQILLTGDARVAKLALLTPGAAEFWEKVRDPDAVPMPIAEIPAPEALTELADAMRRTDLLAPRHNEDDFVNLRALAWSRCRPYLPEKPGPAHRARDLVDE